MRRQAKGVPLGGKPAPAEIIASMNQVAEGVKAVSVVMGFADSYGIAMPIAREVDGVINHGATPKTHTAGSRRKRPVTRFTGPASSDRIPCAGGGL